MKKSIQNRREFLKTGAAGLGALGLFGDTMGRMISKDDPFAELVETTIPQLQAKMRSGELTSRRLVEMYLERILSGE